MYRCRFLLLILAWMSPLLVCGNEITLIYTGSANGILESCHCPGNPFGGLVNRVAVVDSLLQEYPEAIVVDCGDFLPAEPDSLKSVYVVKAMLLIKTEAIAPGEQDFNLGRDFLVGSGLPLLSPSLYNPDTRSYMFQNYIIRNTGSVKTAIITLMSPSLFSFFPDTLRQQIGIEAPEASWKRFGPLLREKSEIIILVSHMGYDKDVDFLQKNSNIIILVSGHSQQLLNEPERYGGSLLLAPGKNGEYVGFLQVQLDSLNKIENYKNELIPLIAEKVGESAEIRSLICDYNVQLQKQLKQQAIAAGRKFYGSDFCAGCHVKEYASWQKTAHYSALDTLTDMGKDENPSCLDCHTTGYGYPGGFVSKAETPAKGGIGCEECHRIPPNIDFSSGKPHKVLPLIEKWCTRCHRQPHIIDFNYEQMKQKVEHND